MTARCGSTDEAHTVRNCTECKTLYDKERSDRFASRICPSCKIRHSIPRAPVDVFAPLMLEAREIRWLENAARVFDEYSEEPWSASEFIAWIRPDLTGKGRLVLGDYEGKQRGGEFAPQGHWPPRAA